MVQADVVGVDVVVAVVIDGGGLVVMAMVMGILGNCFPHNLGRLDSGWRKAFWC